jgi:glycosyltransferase involved in cell wall biosynthesis
MNKRIKVLFLEQAILDGGGGQSLFQLLKTIDKTLIEPMVMLPKAEGHLGPRLIDHNAGTVIEEAGLFPTPSSYFIKTGSWTVRTFLQIINLLHLLYLTFFKLPRFITSNEIDVLYSNTSETRFVSAVGGWISGAKVIWHLRNVPARGSYLFFKLLVKLPSVQKVITLSRGHQKSFLKLTAKQVMVYNGIDLDEFDPIKVPKRLRKDFMLPDDALIFAMTGRLVSKKGHNHFLQAGKHLIVHCPNLKIYLVIIGGSFSADQDVYRLSLTKLAYDLQISENVIFTGYQADIKPYLNDIDVVAVPSLWAEPFGRTALEPMAFGIPVVGYDAGGLGEIISHNETGLLCHLGNVNQLGEAMVCLAKDDEKRLRFGKNARKRAGSIFDIKVKTREIENIINDIAGRGMA